MGYSRQEKIFYVLWASNEKWENGLYCNNGKVGGKERPGGMMLDSFASWHGETFA